MKHRYALAAVEENTCESHKGSMDSLHCVYIIKTANDNIFQLLVIYGASDDIRIRDPLIMN